MKDKYYDQAVACTKDHVLPAQIELYQSCNGDLDRVYGEAMNGNGYFGSVIEPGRVYELGYERCTCPKVLSGQITDPDQCNCSRQSIPSSVALSRAAISRWRSWKPYCAGRSTAGSGSRKSKPRAVGRAVEDHALSPFRIVAEQAYSLCPMTSESCLTSQPFFS